MEIYVVVQAIDDSGDVISTGSTSVDHDEPSLLGDVEALIDEVVGDVVAYEEEEV